MREISDEELSVFMAIEIRGWQLKTWDKVMEWFDGDTHMKWGSEYTPPTDLNQAMECVEKVCPETHLFKLLYDTRSKVYRSFFQTEKVSYEYFFGVPKEDKSPARAVCLAVRAFVEAKK